MGAKYIIIACLLCADLFALLKRNRKGILFFLMKVSFRKH